MSGPRWATRLGIVAGGAGGALAALLGAPRAHAPKPAAPSAVARAEQPAKASSTAEKAPDDDSTPDRGPSSFGAAPSSAAAPKAGAAALPSIAPAALPASSASASAPNAAAQDPLTTREALLKAELYCDRKKDFDECTRAALALESGSAGPADPVQAKRFRRIALTHLVAQCEAGSPHACYVLAAKYRAGNELPPNPAGAEALEKRGAELCRVRSAPECSPR